MKGTNLQLESQGHYAVSDNFFVIKQGTSHSHDVYLKCVNSNSLFTVSPKNEQNNYQLARSLQCVDDTTNYKNTQLEVQSEDATGVPFPSDDVPKKHDKYLSNAPSQDHDDSQKCNKSTALDCGWAWMVLFSVCFINGLNAGMVSSWGALYPGLQQHLQVSLTAVSWVASIFNGMHVIGGSLGPLVLQRFGCRGTGLVGVTLITGGLFSSMFVNDIRLLYFTASIVMGLGHTILLLLNASVIGQYFDRKRPFAFGCFMGGGGLGVLAMPPFVTYLMTSYGLMGTFWLLGGIYLNEYWCVLTFRQVKRNEDSNTQRTPLSLVDQLREYRKLLFLPKTGIMVAGCLVQGLVYLIFAAFMPSVALSVIQGLTIEQAALTVSIMGLGSVFGRLVLGVVVTFHRQHVLRLFILLNICCGITIAMVTVTTTYVMLLCISCVYGFFLGGVWTLQPNLINYLYAAKMFASGYGLLLLCNGLTCVVGSPIASTIADKSGNPMMIFYFGAAGFILTGLIMLPLSFMKQGRQEVVSFTIPKAKRIP